MILSFSPILVLVRTSAFYSSDAYEKFAVGSISELFASKLTEFKSLLLLVFLVGTKFCEECFLRFSGIYFITIFYEGTTLTSIFLLLFFVVFDLSSPAYKTFVIVTY